MCTGQKRKAGGKRDFSDVALWKPAILQMQHTTCIFLIV